MPMTQQLSERSFFLLTEVCHDVRVEPHLQPITEEYPSSTSAIMQDGARLDIAASRLWGGRFQRTILDVRVFNPHAASNHGYQLSSCYRKHTKMRAYKHCICKDEHASYTPLVFSASGGMAKEATSFYKRLACRRKKGPDLQLYHHMAQMLALIFTPPLSHPVHQRCLLLKRPARLQSDPLRCHHAGGSRARVSLT